MGKASIPMGGLSAASWLRRTFTVLAVSTLVLGCDANKRSGKIGSGLFLAPQPELSQGREMRVVLDKVALLSPIDPSLLASEVEVLQAEPFVVGQFPNPDFLLYEGQSRSLLGFSPCLDPDNDCLNPNATPVKLHYSSSGLKDAQGAPQSSIDALVPPIVLKSGWILAFDNNTRSILGFRQVPGYRDRGASVQGSANFGRGNGVLLSVVITGEAIDSVLGSNLVSRMIEIEDGKILLFFESLPAVHLLELQEDERILDHDLSTSPESGIDMVPTMVLSGSIKRFLANPSLPEGPANPLDPLLSFRDVSEEITSENIVNIDRFEPVIVPTDGSALLFDAQTANFFRLSLRRENGEIVGSSLALAVSNTAVFTALATAGVTSGTELEIERSFFHATETEICFLEATSTNILCYDYTQPPAANPTILSQLNLRVFVNTSDIVFAFDPRGPSEDVAGSDPSLVFASGDVTENRIAFDRSRNLLLAISYSTAKVVVMARRSDLVAVTGDAIVDLSVVTTIDADNVRAFDTQSVSFLEIPLRYEAFPITITN